MKTTLFALLIFSLCSCQSFFSKEAAPVDEVEVFASEVTSKIEALYIQDQDEDFLRVKGEASEKKEGREYIRYSAEKAFPNRTISVQLTELVLGSRKYYKIFIVTKTAEGGKRSVEKIEMRQEDIKKVIERVNISLRKVL